MQNVSPQIGPKKFMWLKKVSVSWMYGTTKTNWKENNQKEFRVQKVIKSKRDKIYVKWKATIIPFNGWNDNKDIV